VLVQTRVRCSQLIDKLGSTHPFWQLISLQNSIMSAIEQSFGRISKLSPLSLLLARGLAEYADGRRTESELSKNRCM